MRTLFAAAAAPLALAACGEPDGQSAARGDITIDDPAAYPESITSMSDGTVIIGGSQGKVFRAGPGETVATTWIESSPENGMQAVLGVLADENSDTLWLCSIPAMFGGGGAAPAANAVSGLMAFDLATGERKGAYPFPPNGLGAAGVCNDIAVAADGTVYATDTPGGRILMLAPGADALELYEEDTRLVGIDGIAFAEDGVMYVNNVQTHELIRVVDGGGMTMNALGVLTPSLVLDGPDGMRPLDGNRFVQAEGPAGRISIVTVDGEMATITPIREGLESSPGVTVTGDTAYAIEGKINYLMDPDLQGQDPGPFVAHAIPQNTQDQTQ
jgi:outer membrane protein assembly factor BamB